MGARTNQRPFLIVCSSQSQINHSSFNHNQHTMLHIPVFLASLTFWVPQKLQDYHPDILLGERLGGGGGGGINHIN